MIKSNLTQSKKLVNSYYLKLSYLIACFCLAITKILPKKKNMKNLLGIELCEGILNRCLFCFESIPGHKMSISTLCSPPFL